MPELPDVEGFRRYLDDRARGRTVRHVRVPDPELLRNTTPQKLGRAVDDASIGAPGRHGKWLLLPIGSACTVWHFGMTGAPRWVDGHADLDTHDRVVLCTDGGELRLRMMRRLGGVWLLHAGEDLEAVTGPLGPDALDVDGDTFAVRVGGRRGGVKSALMDQGVIAGLGNLLVDEILWHACVHPRSAAGALGGELARLHRALGEVLDAAIPTGRVPPAEGTLTAARDADEPTCPRDGTLLRRDTVAGRRTWWCPTCQTEPPS